MQCSVCGTGNPEGSASCSQCGTPLPKASLQGYLLSRAPVDVQPVQVQPVYVVQAQPPQSPYVPPKDGSSQDGMATASLVLGIVTYVAWCFPILPMIASIAGLVLGILGLKSNRRGQAIAGIVLSGMAVAVVIAYPVFVFALAMIGSIRH
jgi:hypothetical protein